VTTIDDGGLAEDVSARVRRLRARAHRKEMARLPVTTASQCASFSSTGVAVNRTIVQSDGGHVVSITDAYTSTDGRPHTLDLLYENNQIAGDSGPSGQTAIGYEFPGQGGFAAHVLGDIYTPPIGAGTIFIKDLLTFDGDPFTGQGAITYSTAPTQILFNASSGGQSSDFTMHYAGTVPANEADALTYHFIYSTDLTGAAVAAEALPAEDAFITPTLKVHHPAVRSRTPHSIVTVTGTASDQIMLRTVTVNRRVVPTAANGSFKATVALKHGPNTITVTATNEAGKMTTAKLSIVYTPLLCVVRHRARRC